MSEVQLEFDATWGQAVRRAFGARVRALRHSVGVSQEQLALQASLDRSYIGQVERGERNLTLENIYRLADALRVPPRELLPELDGSLDLEQGDRS